MITLATLHAATAQQVFDQVAVHLLQQNKRSTEQNSTVCRYRGYDGCKCAAGCLISDEEYSEQMESLYWQRLIAKGFVSTNAHLSLIRDLQDVHDEADLSQWKNELIRVANNYKLNVKAIQ